MALGRGLHRAGNRRFGGSRRLQPAENSFQPVGRLAPRRLEEVHRLKPPRSLKSTISDSTRTSSQSHVPHAEGTETQGSLGGPKSQPASHGARASLVEAAAHARPLRALAREEEGHLNDNYINRRISVLVVSDRPPPLGGCRPPTPCLMLLGFRPPDPRLRVGNPRPGGLVGRELPRMRWKVWGGGSPPRVEACLGQARR